MKKASAHFAFVLPVTAFLISCSHSLAPGSTTLSSVGTSQDERELRVMTYNIHHANPPGKGKTGKIDIDAIVKVIKNENPDLVALQEVDVNTSRSGKVNQAEAIAAKLGMYALFGRAIDFGGGQYGVAILSRYPLSETQVLSLPEDAAPQAEDRVIALATLTLPGGKVVRFGSTHLDVLNEDNRVQQVRQIGSAVNDEPLIIAGDLNALPESAAIAELDKKFTRTCANNCGFTFPADAPTRTIDYIAYSKGAAFRVVSQRVVPESYASDHLPVIATLRY